MIAAGLDGQTLETAHSIERILVWARRVRFPKGVSATAFTTLDRLAFAGPMRISDLAEREGISQPGMTSLVNRLEGEGLAKRAADPTDGRASLVSVTEAGRALLTTHRGDRERFIATRIGELGSVDQAALFGAISAIEHLTADLQGLTVSQSAQEGLA